MTNETETIGQVGAPPVPLRIFKRWAVIENGIPREITFDTFEIDGVLYKGSTLYVRGDDAIFSLGIKRIVDEYPPMLKFQRPAVKPSSEWIVDGNNVHITYDLEEFNIEETIRVLKQIVTFTKDRDLFNGYYAEQISDYIQIQKADIENLTYVKNYLDLQPNENTTVKIRAASNINHEVSKAVALEIIAGAFAKYQQVTQTFWQYMDQANAVKTNDEARILVEILEAL